jgi:uncharacterized protein YdcH (DUF465 family)
MSNTPHTLHDEFPADAQKISARLKVSDAHFAKLLVDYDRGQRQGASGGNPAGPADRGREEHLRKAVALKDDRSRLKGPDRHWPALTAPGRRLDLLTEEEEEGLRDFVGQDIAGVRVDLQPAFQRRDRPLVAVFRSQIRQEMPMGSNRPFRSSPSE